MQEKHLFEYAVIRVVPRVEREEFLNVGVILYCSKGRFLKTLYEVNAERLLCFSAELDILEISKRLQAFDHICAGAVLGGAIAQLPVASRFRWLTATRSTVIQTSSVHPGLCIDPLETLQQLHQKLVL